MKTVGPIHARHPHQLMGTKWTKLDPLPSPPEAGLSCDLAHWEVEGYQPRAGLVVLRASLSPERKLILPWRQLRDRAQWTPGWTTGLVASSLEA